MADSAPGAGSDHSHNVVPRPAKGRGVPDRERVERTKEWRLRVAMLVPPWIPVPPPGYGGIEFVVALSTNRGATPLSKRNRRRAGVAWTVLLLVFPAALWLWTPLWLWTLVAHLVRRTSSDLAASPTQGASEAQREQTHRRASAEGLPVLAVECRGVATRLHRRRVALDPGRSAAALAAPAHRVAVAGEAVSMAKKAAAQH